jgi:hypothetical protein
MGFVAGDFPNLGVWRFADATGWRELTGVRATSLQINSRGDVAGEFPGHGVFLFTDAAGFRRLTTFEARTVGLDADDDVVGEFPNLGVFRFLAAGGVRLLTSSEVREANNSDQGEVGISATGDVVADVNGGLFFFPAAGGTPVALTAIDAAFLSVA